jgi:hypothetical protein
MIEAIALAGFACYPLAMLLFVYISIAKVKPTVEKYTNIDWYRTKTFEKYRLIYVDYRKICKKNGSSLKYSNILIFSLVFIFVVFICQISLLL